METNENENTAAQNLWDAAEGSPKREVYSNTGLGVESKLYEELIQVNAKTNKQTNKQSIPIKSGQRTRTDISPKNTSR